MIVNLVVKELVFEQLLQDNPFNGRLLNKLLLPRLKEESKEFDCGWIAQTPSVKLTRDGVLIKYEQAWEKLSKIAEKYRLATNGMLEEVIEINDHLRV